MYIRVAQLEGSEEKTLQFKTNDGWTSVPVQIVKRKEYSLGDSFYVDISFFKGESDKKNIEKFFNFPDSLEFLSFKATIVGVDGLDGNEYFIEIEGSRCRPIRISRYEGFDHLGDKNDFFCETDNALVFNINVLGGKL